MSFSVLLARPEHVLEPTLADAIAAVRKIPRVDAARAARSAYGIVGEGLDEPAAQALAGVLNERGLTALVRPDAALAALPPVMQAQAAALSGEGIVIKLADGRQGELKWANVSLTAFFGYKTKTTVAAGEPQGPSLGAQVLRTGLLVTTGIPLPGGKKKAEPKTVEQVVTVFAFDLFARTPATRIRIPTQPFDFTCLGAQMAPSAQSNLMVLFRLALERAPRALRNAGARHVLERRPLSNLPYDSLKDLDRECRWLLSLPPVQ
jgi:hypothetical protein